MNKLFCSMLIIPAALAAGSGDNDTVFKALADELNRTMSRLELKGHPKPYYVSYTVREYETRSVSASFGAITDQSVSHFRNLAADVRIGDYKQDSSSTSSGLNLASMLGSQSSSSLTVDDNYDALRRGLWLQTDKAYKNALERMKAYENYLKQNTIEDKPDSFSKEKPVVHIEPIKHIGLDMQKWSSALRRVSAVFKDYPVLRNSRADAVSACLNRWFVNSEGFRYRVGDCGCLIYLSAQALAPDGMRIADEDVLPAWTESELPSEQELNKSARALAERLKQLAASPVVNNYRGPVLFEGQAGAEFFHQLLDSKLLAGGGSGSSLFRLSGGSDMNERIGERFLPKFISVIDDPTAKEFNGQTLYGSYEIDDDGIVGQKITLIDKGILKTLCTGRVPTRKITQSNGHWKNGVAATSNVFIESENKLSSAALKTRLIELGKEDGLKEVYIVRKLLSRPVDFSSATLQSLLRTIASGGSEASLYAPVLLYRVSTEDGHEELCRGGTFTNFTMRVLRDIDATGDDAAAYPTIARANYVTSIVAPSVVVKEIEIQRPDRTNSKGPVLKNPYFEKD